jgi:hypothetical protein
MPTSLALPDSFEGTATGARTEALAGTSALLNKFFIAAGAIARVFEKNLW